jgi:molybdopterin molybdotransferase
LYQPFFISNNAYLSIKPNVRKQIIRAKKGRIRLATCLKDEHFGFMLQFEEALARILAAIPPPAGEAVPLDRACGRVLLEPVTSPIDLPPFDNSAMDGYAVRATDVTSASAASPVRLRLSGRIAAGESLGGEVAPGSCVRLFTGSPLPRGADAVVMQEDTRVEPNEPQQILVLDTVKPWENVRRSGEDVKQGETLAEAGHILTVGHLCLLAATGRAEVKVGKQPVVGLLATGSELREPGQQLGPGQIYESNRLGLAALLGRIGCVPKCFPLVADAPDAVRAALETALTECDAVITSGGVSVGEMDFVKSAFESVGGELQFWRVAMKPGRPFVFGRYQGKFLFGLPGNPVSALVTFLLLARPALLRWQGAKDVSPPRSPGVLAEPLANPGPRRHFMRVTLAREGKVFSAGLQASHALGSLAAANGLVDVSPETRLPAGAHVQVLRWD